MTTQEKTEEEAEDSVIQTHQPFSILISPPVSLIPEGIRSDYKISFRKSEAGYSCATGKRFEQVVVPMILTCEGGCKSTFIPLCRREGEGE